jgi:outer membrane translocation and assembly module TamA
VPGVSDLAGDFRVAGLGPQLVYDSRDSNYFPLSGQYFRASWLNFAPAWGGDFSYNTTDTFYNYYAPLAPRAVLALRARLQTASEGAPFFDLPTLDMRGFARDRYRDNYTLSLIAEGRCMFRPRWGAVVYVEAGRFASTLSTLKDGRTITTYGGGLRWQVTSSRDMNIGFDYAVSSDDSAAFIQVGERF